MSDDSSAPAPGGELVLYQTEDGQTRVQCRFSDGTIWLTQVQIAELFQTSVPNVNIHLKNIYAEGELAVEATIKDYLIVRIEGTRQVSRQVLHYSLEAILAVGYRVQSPRGTQFRQWATARLQEYLVKGFVMDDERLKNPPGPDVPDYFDELLERIRDIRPLVAFSGTVKDPDTGHDYTESGMNLDCVTGKPIGEKQLPERFASSDYQVLLVANKYQTGFDQPLLQAMYVDKRLDGVQAVQTLSRLNRMVPGKEAPFVLDFVNETEDIYRAFKPYYDGTSLAKDSDPHQLEQLKHDLDGAQVYHWSEVEAFARIFYKAPDKQVAQDHARMQVHLQPAVDRFKGIDDEAKRTEFRDKLAGYVRIYAFLSQIIPYGDPALEMLYSYGRLLLPHLPLDRDTTRVKIGDEVGLQYYRLQRTFSGGIPLQVGEAAGVKSPTDVGTGKAKEEKAPLSEIIKVLNERFGTSFTDEDRFFFEQIREKAATDEQVIKLRLANPFDKFQIGLRQLIADLMVQRMGENDKIVTRYMDDKEFNAAAFDVLSRSIYDAIPAPDSGAGSRS